MRAAYPDIPTHWIQGGIALTRAGETSEAKKLMMQAKERFASNPNFPIILADLAIEKEDWELAEKVLFEAQKLFPGSCATWLKYAELETHKGEFERAQEYSAKAKELWESLSDQFPEAVKEFDDLFLEKSAVNQTENIQFDEPNLVSTIQPFGPKHLSQLVWTKALFNLRSEVHHNYLSYLWWVIEPVLHMLVYYIVFSFLLQRGGDNFTVFLLTGLIPWLWFSKSVSSSSNTIIAGQSLMLQTSVPAIYFPLVKFLQTTIKQIPVFILLFVFIWSQGYTPSVEWFALIPIIVVQLTITLAFVLGIAAAIPFVRDLGYLVPTGIAFMFFLSGIFYDYKNISPEWQGLFLKNPIAYLLKCYREILMEHTTPNLLTLSIWGLISGSVCIVLLLSYRRLRCVFPRVVME